MLKKLYWIMSAQLGIDPRRFLFFVMGIPRFVLDLLKFRGRYAGKISLWPCLHDWGDEGGAAKGEYFWQDLYVAQEIHRANPERHVDIGSRLDGFVAHVASFREIEVLDIRPISAEINRVTFRQADLMNPSEVIDGYCDSVSCLHALEHFGLGRYGDEIDPEGHLAGLANLARMLKIGGVLYLSLPIGIERVEFNANRIVDPIGLVKAAENCRLKLAKFSSFRVGSRLRVAERPMEAIAELARGDYALGIFSFVKEQ
jgi:SAM-dependent methyltransferase